jgi:transcriptional regulator with XRE-family HTH domain/predicted DNA-binding transcriptional regulator AlpA
MDRLHGAFFFPPNQGDTRMPARIVNKENVSPERKAMAQRLNDIRIDRHWTQKELSKRSNVHTHIITNIESGHVINPAAEAILRLAKTFNVRPEWLLDGSGDKFVAGPAPLPEAETITIERIPLEVAKTMLKVVEEMQYSRLFCEDTISTKHIDRWLGCLLGLKELRSIGDHFMRAALENDPAQPGHRPTLVVNNVSVLPERTVETGVVLPKAEAQPVVVGRTAQLRPPPPDRASIPDDDAELTNIVITFDPHKGTKLGKIKRGSYTDLELKKRAPLRKDGLLRQSDVLAMLGITAGVFWGWQQNDPDFPKPAEVTESGKITGYRRADFEAYLRLKLMERKTKPKAARQPAIIAATKA